MDPNPETISIYGNTGLHSRNLVTVTQFGCPSLRQPPPQTQFFQQRLSIYFSRYSLNCTPRFNSGLALTCKDPPILRLPLGYLCSYPGSRTHLIISQPSHNGLMPARSKRNENRVQKQSFISDAVYSPSISPVPFATSLDNTPALSAFNSPALVTRHLSDTEPEDVKETRGKVQEDLEFSARAPPQPLSVQTSTPLHHTSESTTPAMTTGHTRAPVLSR